VQRASEDRLRSLQSLLTFMEQAVEELAWLSEKEEIEISRDWSSQNLQLQELEDYFEVIVPVVLCQMYWTLLDTEDSKRHTCLLTPVSSTGYISCVSHAK